MVQGWLPENHLRVKSGGSDQQLLWVMRSDVLIIRRTRCSTRAGVLWLDTVGVLEYTPRQNSHTSEPNVYL